MKLQLGISSLVLAWVLWVWLLVYWLAREEGALQTLILCLVTCDVLWGV